MINRHSKMSSHFSLQYLLAGSWRPDRSKTVDFEKALLEGGLDFSQINIHEKGFSLSRRQPSQLQVRIESPGPQVTTLQIVSQNPQYDLGSFCRDAEAVTGAFQRTWPADHYQVLTTTGKIHHLYSTQTHAFKYLWEERLGQMSSDFQALGRRPVAGGGLRLLMPPHATEGGEPVSIELRVESFLREPNKLLTETVFTWPRPRVINGDQGFSPQSVMDTVEQFAANEVWNFISEKCTGGD